MTPLVKALLALALVVPLVTYVAGSLSSSGVETPEHQGTVYIDDVEPARAPTTSPPSEPTPQPTPSRGTSDRDNEQQPSPDGDDDGDDGKARVVTPAPVEDDDERDDDGDDRDDTDDGDDTDD